MRLIFILPILIHGDTDLKFGRPSRSKKESKKYSESDVKKASDIMESQLNFKTIQDFMDFEGYTDRDWKIDYQGIVRSFLTDESSPKGPAMVGRMNRSSALSAEDREYMSRYLQLKYAVLFLQKRKTFGKYCFYGCWCLPRGALDIGVGQGKPVDSIDGACHDYSTCYNCLYSKEIGKQCDENDQGNYKMSGKNNPSTGEKILICMDPIGSCLRERCECDLQLAKKLSEHEEDWNVENHRRWGDNPFNAEEKCRASHHKTTTQSYVPPSTAAPVIVTTQVITVSENKKTKEKNNMAYFAPLPMNSEEQSETYPSIEPLTVVSTTTSPMVEGPNVTPYAMQDGDSYLPSTTLAAARPYVTGFVSKDTEQSIENSPNSSFKPEESVNHAGSPLHGKIVGCCGTAPYVHYYRHGQKCCPDGKITDLNMPCDYETTF